MELNSNWIENERMIIYAIRELIDVFYLQYNSKTDVFCLLEC